MFLSIYGSRVQKESKWAGLRTEAPGLNPVARLMEACVCQGNGGQWGDKLF